VAAGLMGAPPTEVMPLAALFSFLRKTLFIVRVFFGVLLEIMVGTVMGKSKERKDSNYISGAK
jgi:uncharacterized membrane protein YraQ (UPF0718 family)